MAGVEAAVWTETLRTWADVETMLLPRLCAVAEVAWTPPAQRDWDDFRRRVRGRRRAGRRRASLHALAAIQAGAMRPSTVLTHTLPLDDAAEAYRAFDAREMTKVVLLT